MNTMILDENRQSFTIIDNSVLDEIEVFESINEKMVYITLKKFAFGGSEKVFPGVKTIAKMCLLSERSVQRVLCNLKEKGLIDIRHRTKENRQNDTNLYIIKNFNFAKKTFLDAVADGDTVTGGMVSESHQDGDTVTVGMVSESHQDGDTVTPEEYEFKKTNLNKTKRRRREEETSPSPSENPFHFYQNNFGMMSPFLAEEIGYWVEDLSEELVIQALKITLERNKRTWGYTKSILNDWHSKNIKTIKDLEASELTRKTDNLSKPTRSKKDPLTALEEYKRKRGLE